MLVKEMSLCDKGQHRWSPMPNRDARHLRVERCVACGAVATWLPATELWEGAV